jgi:hypothetical protein
MTRERMFVVLWVGIATLVTAMCLVDPRSLVRRVGETVLSADYARFRSVKRGWTEAQVKAKLGNPYRVCKPSNASSACWVSGFAHPRRPATGPVYVYLGDEPIAYVFLDLHGNVEEVFVGGS